MRVTGAIDKEKESEGQQGLGVVDFLKPVLAFLWDGWSREMELSGRSESGFCLVGICPYKNCRTKAAFPSVTSYHVEETRYNIRMIGVCKCQACGKYILGIIKQLQMNWFYLEHYPVDTPGDDVAGEIPEEIAGEFKEALRCRWIKSFKATVLMCRRALQVSCDREEAEGKDLFTQIDYLAQQQKITKPLRDMAHRIRLSGKKGAHGNYSDLNDVVEEKDADEAILFMRHYLDHVYVLPKQLEEDAS